MSDWPIMVTREGLRDATWWEGTRYQVAVVVNRIARELPWWWYGVGVQMRARWRAVVRAWCS